MGKWQGIVLGAILVGAPAAAVAQVPGDAAQPAPAASQSVHRSYVFLEPALRVAIVGQAAGSIEVIRGEDGLLDVTATVPAGAALPATARSAPAELTLLAGGTGPVQYLLVVPRSATVTVARAGHPAVSLGTLDRSRRWNWPAEVAPSAELPH